LDLTLPLIVVAFGAGFAIRARLPRRLPEPQAAATDAPPSEPLARLREVIELLPEPMLLLDRSGAMRHANHAAREPFGDVLAALLRHPALGEAVRRLDGETIVVTTVKMDVPVRRVLRASLKALPAPYGGLLILSLADGTPQATVERMREDFIANASHELRTPLASLIGFIDTLLGPAADDPPAQQRFLLIMQTQAARMRRLIDSLLSLSRIQMMEHERPRARVALDQLASHVAESVEPLTRARKVALSLDIEPGLPPVQGDADQLVQVIQNLLDNALKYARTRVRLSVATASPDTWPASGATLGATLGATPGAMPGSSSPAGLVLRVEDDGPGIASHHLPRLTERFYRVEEGKSERSGSGLGLAIVKHIVGRHQGRFLAESSVGQGSVFSVWLPVGAVTKPTS